MRKWLAVIVLNDSPQGLTSSGISPLDISLASIRSYPQIDCKDILIVVNKSFQDEYIEILVERHVKLENIFILEMKSLSTIIDKFETEYSEYGVLFISSQVIFPTISKEHEKLFL